MTDNRITKTQRWLDLIALLLNRKLPLSVEEIMERVPAYASAGSDATALASARRMFERDKDELRKMGIPIETVRYDINFGHEQLEGYRITRRDFYLPYLQVVAGESDQSAADTTGKPYPGLPGVELTLEQAEVAIDALRLMEGVPAFPMAAEARSALHKLAFDLPADAVAEAPILWVERPGTRQVLETLRVLSEALLARKRVRFAYQGIHRGAPTERDVAPYGLFFQRDWYLVGHDATRDEVRVFRVARIAEPAPNPRAPKLADYEIPADFDLQRYLDRSAWELGDPGDVVEAEVSFSFPLSITVDRAGEGEVVEKRADGSSLRRFRVSQRDPFLRWVLGFAGDAEIVSPPELVADFEEMAGRVAALYGGAEAHG